MILTHLPVQVEPRPIAVVIETQMTANLIPIMLHFSSVLGPTWTIRLYTLEADWTTPPSTAFRRATADGRIDISWLPPATNLSSSTSVSSFLTSPWL
jgi:hypothetical protein